MQKQTELPERVLLRKDGTQIKEGDKVTSFRGEEWIVIGWSKNGRNRIYVQEQQFGSTAEYFPNLFDLTWNYDFL